MKKNLILIFLLFISLFTSIFARNCDSDKLCFCGDNLISNKNLVPIEYTNPCLGYGIKIENDNTILNCQDLTILGDNNYKYSGIIINANNVTVKNCIVENFYNGIEIRNSNSGQILNNTLSSNYASGISIYNSSNYIISGNIITNNSWDGIFMIQSSNNTISNNKINLNEVDGIQVYNGSINNIIFSNDLRFNNGHAIAPIICSNTIDKTNLGGEGKPIYYVEDALNINILNTNEFSEIIFCNVRDSKIDSVSFDNGEYKTDGILLVSSENIIIQNSNFKNVRAGVYLASTSNSKILNNHFSNNDFGIRFMIESDGNIIQKNTFESTNNISIRLDNSDGNIFQENYLSDKSVDFSYKNNVDILGSSYLNYIGEVEYELIEHTYNIYCSLFLALLIVFVIIFLFVKF